MTVADDDGVRVTVAPPEEDQGRRLPMPLIVEVLRDYLAPRHRLKKGQLLVVKI